MLWAHQTYNPTLAEWPDEQIGHSNPTTVVIERTADAPAPL